MIFRIWIKILLVVMIALIPPTVVQYYLQKQSIEVAFELVNQATPKALLDEHLALLKQISQLDPNKKDLYKKKFHDAVEIKHVREDLQLLQGQFIHSLLRETFWFAFVVILASLGLSFFVSKSIVQVFQKLMERLRMQSKRLEKIDSLESWQRVARMLVHELRAPITPIKLISSDLEKKYQVLEARVFQQYLSESSSLMMIEVAAIERFLENFTRFAKLPEVKRTPQALIPFLETFISSYGSYSEILTQFKLEVSEGLRQLEVPFDAELVKNILFNLLKNAVEANRPDQIEVTLSVHRTDEMTQIRFKNTGKLIPKEQEARIFDPLFSSKTGVSESDNFGMGLTISKKVALDHGGDLSLLKNSEGEVIFELEFSNQ